MKEPPTGDARVAAVKKEIQDAVNRFEERKEALEAGGGVEKGGLVGAEQMRLLLSGFDLDIEELENAAGAAVNAARQAHLEGIGTGHLIAGTWADGLVTGMMLAEARK